MRLSFVIPVYNERETLEPLVQGILEHATPHDVELIFIDDGSTDGSADEMLRLRVIHPEIRVVRLRSNFGKSTGLAIGFTLAGGEAVFTMDADLQDDPKEIPHFIEKMDEGYDIVCGWKQERHDPWHKTMPSRYYNAGVAWLFDIDLHDINCGFKLYRADVIKRINLYGEMHRLIPVQARALGFKRITEIPVEHHPRRYGVSKYGFERFARGAMDVITLWFMTRYARRPGHLFGLAGASCLGMGFVLLVLWALSLLVLHPSGVLFLGGIGLAMGGAVLMAASLLAEMMVYYAPPLNPDTFVLEDHPAERFATPGEEC